MKRDGAKFLELVEVVALGNQTIREWADANGVRYQTARAWACLPGFRRRVAEVRKQLLDQAIGVLTESVAKVAAKMVSIALEAEGSPAVQLNACRGVLDDLIKAYSLVDVQGELDVLRTTVKELQGRLGDAAPIRIADGTDQAGAS